MENPAPKSQHPHSQNSAPRDPQSPHSNDPVTERDPLPSRTHWPTAERRDDPDDDDRLDGVDDHQEKPLVSDDGGGASACSKTEKPNHNDGKKLPKLGVNDEPEQPGQPMANSRFIEYEGRRVEVGSVFDMERVISLGTAQNYEITGQRTVAEAVKFVQSATSKRELDDAHHWAAKIQNDLPQIIANFHKKGLFDFSQSVFLQGVWGDQKKKLIQELTSLLKQCKELDEEEITDEFRSISWRHAKVMRLSAFMWTGKFSVRSNSGLLNSSGLACVDLDKLKVNIEELMEALKADPLVFWAARSPSRSGVKLLVRIPDDAALNEKTFLACFETFERYIALKYPGVAISVDRQAKAVAQLCFVMHDPDSFCKPDAYVLQPDDDLVSRHVDGVKVTPEKTLNASGQAADAKVGSQQKSGSDDGSRGFPFDKYPAAKQWETVRTAMESLEEWLADLPRGQGVRNFFWTRIGYAFGAWFQHLDDASIRDEARTWLLDMAGRLYAGNEGCVERAMNGSDGSCGLGTLFKIAIENGDWTPPWKSEREAGDKDSKTCLMDFVEEFQNSLPPMKCVRGRWYAFINGLWQPVEPEIYEPTALKLLPRALKSSRWVTEVMATFQNQQQVPRQSLKTAIIWEDGSQSGVLINCRNGLLRVTADTAQLMPHDAKTHCFTGQLAAAYDQNASAETFERVFFEAQPEEQAQNLLYWWFGYVLCPSLKFRLSLVNYGPSTTGKSSIWQYGVGAAIGPALMKNLSLSDICASNGYSIPALQHALLNVGGELDADELGHSSRFKLLVGGEPLEVRSIYGKPFDMTDYIAKLVFTTNHMPRFKNGTDAELRRIQFLCWNQVPVKPDTALLGRVEMEKDGVFSFWMVPALQDILGGLKPLPDEMLVRSQFAIRNDPMMAFLGKCCVISPDATIGKNLFRHAFAHFVDQHDLPPGLREGSVCGRLLLERTFGKVKAVRPRQKGSREQLYAGLKLNPELERELNERIGSSTPYLDEDKRWSGRSGYC